MGDQEEKIRCIMNRQQISESEAKKKIKQVDKDRSSYYKYYTDQIWGESENYDLCINSSKIGITGTVNVIKAYIENNK
jgi:cytidylate kinase